MTLNDYQLKAMTTCMPSSENFSYMMLNLVGEVGEFSDKVTKHVTYLDIASYLRDLHYVATDCGKLAKMIRKGEVPEELNLNLVGLTDDEREELKKEAGDILWQLSGLCHVMGWTLEDVAQQNLDKLASRQQRNVIDGDGDNR